MKEKRSKGLGGSTVIPEPLTPYPYIATAFFTVIFVSIPLVNPYLATGFKTRKCNLNAILRRYFRSKRARTNKPNVERTMPLMNGSPMPQPLLLALKWRGHSNRLVRIGSALSRSVVSLSRSVERSLSSCRAVELDTLTPRHMQSGGFLSRSVEVCQVAVELSCRVAVK